LNVELTTGALNSAVAMVATKKVDIGKSVRDWILSLSRFVYHSGHPVWDDDQRFKRVSKEYRSVALAFLMLNFKTAAHRCNYFHRCRGDNSYP
jgi:hypothetical protein